MSYLRALTFCSALMALFVYAACQKSDVQRQAKNVTSAPAASKAAPKQAKLKTDAKSKADAVVKKSALTKKEQSTVSKDEVLKAEAQAAITKGKLTANDVRKETEEAIAALRVFTQQKEQEYHKRIDSEIAKFNARLEELRGQADSIGSTVKAQVSSEIAQLSEGMKATEDQIAAINLNNEGKLQALTKDLETMLAGLEDVFPEKLVTQN